MSLEIITLKDIITKKCDEYSEKIAIIEKNKDNVTVNHTYRNLKEDVLDIGTALYNSLEIRDTKVAIIGENSYKWLVSYLAVTSGLGVVVPLDKELPAAEIENLIKRSKVTCIIYSAKKKEVIDDIRSKVSKNIKFINMDIYKHNEHEYSFDELLVQGKDLLHEGYNEYKNIEIDPDKFAILLFTSGTTSDSKGVMLSNRNIISNGLAVVERYPEIVKLRGLSFLPMHHTYEFSITYVGGLLGGGTIAISQGLKYLISNFKEFTPDVFCCVPLLLDNIRKKIEKNIRLQKKEEAVSIAKNITNVLTKVKIDLKKQIFKNIHDGFGGRLKYIIVGGAATDKETIEAMEGYGFTVLQGYGLTETSPLISSNLLHSRRAGTVGIPLKSVEVRIDLKSDEIENTGEIMVSGPNVMLGYYEDEEETEKVMKKGWFYTGDIGYFDNKGDLVISGRCKNVIVTSNGKNIYPEELENLINRIPYVLESMVYGSGDNNHLIVKAKLILDEEYIKEKYRSTDITEEEIKKLIWNEIKKINQKVVSYKAIKDFEIKEGSFEKTTTMKIKRRLEQ